VTTATIEGVPVTLSFAAGVALVDKLGRLADAVVTDRHGPSWWVLADAEGNEACVATWLGRD
jgi:hypothetical protein